MAEKIPEKPRKNMSRKKETEQKSQKTSTVTPIDQAGLGQSQARTSETPTLTGSRQAGSVQAESAGGRGGQMRLSGQELHERISARAYELFELRGRREGYDQEDWAQAEAEVLKEFEREKSA
ncbi:MAG TPA: DUF2934 domain-containing protein [Candidatus Angelobacter sp.]|nr:DUF2934 domain-containing protein [Candidatus Angelobacter sp.]